MKHHAIALVTTTALLGTAPALADRGDSCHFYGSKPAAEETVLTCAAQRKLDASWTAVKHENVEQVDGKKGKEWRVTFKNPQMTDAAKQTLYVFLSLPGNGRGGELHREMTNGAAQAWRTRSRRLTRSNIATLFFHTLIRSVAFVCGLRGNATGWRWSTSARLVRSRAKRHEARRGRHSVASTPLPFASSKRQSP